MIDLMITALLLQGAIYAVLSTVLLIKLERADRVHN